MRPVLPRKTLKEANNDRILEEKSLLSHFSNNLQQVYYSYRGCLTDVDEIWKLKKPKDGLPVLQNKDIKDLVQKHWEKLARPILLRNGYVKEARQEYINKCSSKVSIFKSNPNMSQLTDQKRRNQSKVSEFISNSETLIENQNQLKPQKVVFRPITRPTDRPSFICNPKKMMNRKHPRFTSQLPSQGEETDKLFKNKMQQLKLNLNFTQVCFREQNRTQIENGLMIQKVRLQNFVLPFGASKYRSQSKGKARNHH